MNHPAVEFGKKIIYSTVSELRDTYIFRLYTLLQLYDFTIDV